jgi:hypothetical protein
MSNKKDTIEEMEAMRKTIETMQIEREQREIAMQIEREQREIAMQIEREQREIAMRKTIETMQIEREQREIEREQREIEHRSKLAEINSRADTANQKSLKILALIAEKVRKVEHPPTRAGIPGKFFIEHNNFIDYNNKYIRLYIMRKLKLLLSKNIIQLQLRRK